MAEKIWREGMDFLPPPGLRLKARSFGRVRTGINGSTTFQKSSEISQDLTCDILGKNSAEFRVKNQYLFTDKL